jgi:hypothetical protein
LCWEDHEKIGKQYEEDLAEYKWEIRNDRWYKRSYQGFERRWVYG